MAFKPVVYFDYLHPRQWIGRTVKELYKEMDTLRIRLKKVSGYGYDNSHFVISDICGHPALKVLFLENDISFWNAKNGSSLSVSFVDVFTEENYDTVRIFIEKISAGFTMCNQCKKWVKDYKPYSFAGAVCRDCFDPTRHRLPDTRGD